MDSIISNFLLAFSPSMLCLVFSGVALGILFGALPGLTATMGVTLLLPFTLSLGLDAQSSMAMLIGIYVGAIYGGSIAAILICTPGTPAAAATVLDGFPMTQRGEAGHAIALAACASFTGGMISAITLTLFSPLLSSFALRFSYPEYFALAIFGLSMIVTISSKDILKGVLSGFFGLLIATIGLDPIAGIPRFSFGQPNLYDGLGFIPVLIGLFAFAQVFYEISQGWSREGKTESPRFSLPSWQEFKEYKFTLLRSGLIGTFIGSLPGAGCDIAAFVSYNEAKRIDKHPERFGQGEPKGIIAAEAANNGATGGAMIPMLTLGVPGDAVTAVMLSALVVQGLQPGPMLFQEHPEVVYPIFGAMMLANIAMLTIGLLSVRVIARIILVDKRVLLPIICVLSVIGAYALQFSMFDVWVAIAMGAVGYGMKRYGFPASPVVLAMILGPMAERNLRQALLLPDANSLMFLSRPISAVLLILATITIAFGFLRRPSLNVEGE